MSKYNLLIGLIFYTTSACVSAQDIRIAIGTQDTTINCAAGGLLIRELNLLEKHLPKSGAYQNVRYDIQWSNFTSGAPLTNEMVAGKIDIGSMADFPAAFNGDAFQKAGKQSLFINVLSASIAGSGNGVVVPKNSNVETLADLKGKTISVPFASTAHGMLLRALQQQGLNPENDVNLITQAPEIAGSALQTNKVDAHADFVPFAELFPYRGIARKIYDGAQANATTLHGTVVTAEFAKRYPELLQAFLQAALEANQLLTSEPEKYSELIAKLTGIDAEVIYLFHGPYGIQTRDFSWKPEYKQAVKTSFETLKQLKRTSSNLNIDQFIDDSYIRAAFESSGLDYEKQLTNYAPNPLSAKDARSGNEIKDFKHLSQIWVTGEPRVRHYANPASAFIALQDLQKQGKSTRAIYAQDYTLGIKLLAENAWYVVSNKSVTSFLIKSHAEEFAKNLGGTVMDFAAAKLAINS